MQNYDVKYSCAVVPVSYKNGGGKKRNIMLSQNDFKAIQRKGIRKNLLHLESLQDMKILPQRKIF